MSLDVFHEQILPLQSKQKHFSFDIFFHHLAKASPLSATKETTK